MPSNKQNAFEALRLAATAHETAEHEPELGQRYRINGQAYYELLRAQTFAILSIADAVAEAAKR